MALLGAIFVPAVSAVDAEIVEKYSVSQKDAFIGAKNELCRFINDGVMSKDDFSADMLKNEPVLIYDANGLLLYYQFPIEKNGENTGYVKATASKVLGGTVSVIGDSPDVIDYDQLLTDSINNFEKKLSYSEEIADAKIIGYDPSFLGIMLVIKEKNGSKRKVILDSEGNVLFDNSEKNSVLEKYSLYASLNSSKVDDKIKSWNSQFDEKAVASKASNIKNLWTQGNLYTQPNGQWCAVTTGRMIAKWFGVDDSNAKIAGIMDSGTPSNPIMTPDHISELKYYENDPNGLQLSSYYRSGGQLNYNEGRDHIRDRENPFASTVPVPGGNAHSRAIAGYYQGNINYFRVYDPGQIVNGVITAKIYWENYDTSNMMEYILVGW
ncbi:MAG: hypothetical protein PHV39_08835 [Methanomicrobium sp.]|nr:hypothetical protein [Methanomicrobium sp.]